MSDFATRPLVFSALLHASVIAVLVVLMVRVRQAPEPVPFVVDWVSAPVAPTISPDAASLVAPSINFTPVRVPVPVRVPDVEPAAEPAPTRSRVVDNPVATVAPSSPRTTITDHRRRNPVPVSVSTATTAQSSVPSGARINMDHVLDSGAQPGAPSAVMASAEAASYWEALLGKLRAAHQKPLGLADGLLARVEFVLRADGTIGDVRIVNSSGSAEFDASVVAAFRRLTGLGIPPAGKAGLNQVTFRTRAE